MKVKTINYNHIEIIDKDKTYLVGLNAIKLIEKKDGTYIFHLPNDLHEILGMSYVTYHPTPQEYDQFEIVGCLMSVVER